MSNLRTKRAYGLWSSPIGADVVSGSARLGDVAWDGASGLLVWSESSQGHGTLFAAGPDGPRQVTTGLNVRGRLGYGGGEFVLFDGTVYFAADEGRLYRQSLTRDDARPITPAFGAAASPAVHPTGRFVAYVHSVDDVDRIALVDSEGKGWPHIIAEGADFYMHPTWSKDGTMLAWVSWDFPDMPWDDSTLYVARFDESAAGGPKLADVRAVAGSGARGATGGESGAGAGPDGISVMQPLFSPDGRLLAYISDETGFWQIHVYDWNTDRHIQITDGPYEHGVPAWIQGQRCYGFTPDGRSLYFLRNDKGWHTLWRGDLYNGGENVAPRFVSVGGLDEYAVMTQIAVGADRVAFIGTGPDVPPRVVVAELAGEPAGAETEPEAKPGTDAPFPRALHVLRRSQAENFVPGLISRPEPFSWPAPDGTEVHGLYYPPANPRFEGKGAPPAVVSIHGGPTSQSVPEFNGKAQFFTSRGYGFADINYRGSTGFGRAYRNKLLGNWGVVDVEDALGAGRRLAESGMADGERLVIMGSSAGGFTALLALAEAPGFFRAAIDMYGVADLFGLAMDTHKFESRYTDLLVGELPEAAAAYRARSPLYRADKIRDAVAVFQGSEDPVVPKSQSDAIVDALRRNGTPCEYYVYEGEGHGFRRKDTVQAVYNAIDKFLRRHVVFG